MQRENLRRFLFVSAACLLATPWLTPCVGIWSAMAVDGTHNAVTHRDERYFRLSEKPLKEWAAKSPPKLKVRENQPIPAAMWIADAELSSANGGRNAPRPGTMVGKGASAAVDGLASTLAWVDPVTWILPDEWRQKPSTPYRRLVLRGSPFVMMEADEIRYTSEGKDGPVLLARATNAWVSVITPAGSYSFHADSVHYRAPTDELLLRAGEWFQIQHHQLGSSQTLMPLAGGQALWMRLYFAKNILSCAGKVRDPTILTKAEMKSLTEKLRNPAPFPYGAAAPPPKSR
ncbi:hypothetical protein [Prosthecobacter sp.]|uniref:hypothetical protein n=1 Tax=Prosthecobacter sp. TaxID=1965333 RepID=UPI003782E106